MELELRNKKGIVLSLSVLFIIGVIIISNIDFNQGKTKLPGLYISEQETKKGKIITISAPDELNYENVLAYTELSKEAPAEKIHLYHLTEQNKQEVEIEKYDKNNNGLIDYIEWTIPHLSEQTYELIIEITKAEHLDSNRDFISDIYKEVKELDDVWSETISSGDYVRITFEKNLTSENDITIYPKTISENPRIEVYEINGTEIIAEFTSINSNEYNKVYLTNLNRTQDTFDLKVVGGSIEIDYILDPTEATWVPTYALHSDSKEGDVTTDVNADDGTTSNIAGAAGEAAGENIKVSTWNSSLTSSATNIDVIAKVDIASCSGDFQADFSFESSDASQTYICTTTNGQAGVYSCNLTLNGIDTVDEVNSLNVTITGYEVPDGAGPDSGEIDYIWLEMSYNVPSDNNYPIFSTYWDDNATLKNSGTGLFNVTIESTNGTVWLEINNTNITATNITTNVYNASAVFSSSGDYAYTWHSWGNGTNHHYNVSDERSYTVNASADTCTGGAGNWAITCSDNCTWDIDFTVPANITMTGSGTLTWNANMTMNSTINWQIYKDDGCEMVINPGGSIK